MPDQDIKDRIDHLNGRFATLEHIVLVGAAILGPEILSRIVNEIREIDFREITAEKGRSTAFQAGAVCQADNFVAICEKALGDDERPIPKDGPFIA